MRTRDICLVAILSATLTVGKMALSFIANVEVVTLLLTVYALTLPRSRVLLATFTFIATEVFIWGAHIWILMYVIHWTALVLSVSLFKGKYAPIFAIITAITLTGLYGVQTTFLEVLFLMNFKKIGFIKCFMLRYGTGIPYFVTHIVSNACILSVLVYPMYRLMRSLFSRYSKAPLQNEIAKEVSVRQDPSGALDKGAPKDPIGDPDASDRQDGNLSSQGENDPSAPLRSDGASKDPPRA